MSSDSFFAIAFTVRVVLTILDRSQAPISAKIASAEDLDIVHDVRHLFKDNSIPPTGIFLRHHIFVFIGNC